jgi:hypothetical protein
MRESDVHATCHPIGFRYILGAASSDACGARESAGTLIVPGIATPRAIDIPLAAKDDVLSVAESMFVRRARSCQDEGGMLSSIDGAMTYARENAIMLQSGEGATSHTLSILVWKFRDSLP